MKRNILVVANLTAVADELLAALKARAANGPTAVTLIVPVAPLGREPADGAERLNRAIEALRASGVQADGRVVVGGDPIVAVSEAWDPRLYDEIVVSTLPMRVSKWLHAGLPERIANLTGAAVSHIVCEPRPPLRIGPAPVHERSALGPLSVLGWGGRQITDSHGSGKALQGPDAVGAEPPTPQSSG